MNFVDRLWVKKKPHLFDTMPRLYRAPCLVVVDFPDLPAYQSANQLLSKMLLVLSITKEQYCIARVIPPIQAAALSVIDSLDPQMVLVLGEGVSSHQDQAQKPEYFYTHSPRVLLENTALKREAHGVLLSLKERLSCYNEVKILKQ